MWRRYRWWIVAAIVAVSFVIDIAGAAWILEANEQDVCGSIVQAIVVNQFPETEVRMATSESSLRRLHSKPWILVRLTDVNGLPFVRATREQQPKDDFVTIPAGTKVTVVEQKFLSKDGRLLVPYATNQYEMENAGVLEVERIRIEEGPQKNLEGWVQFQCVQKSYPGCSPSL